MPENSEKETHIYSAKSNIAGKGLFTSKFIKKNELAFVMQGPIINYHPINKEEACQLPNIVGIEKDKYIDPIEPYVYINHSCEPNLAYIVVDKKPHFYALRDIDLGEELTFDYSISEYSDWEMTCSCGSKKCRKVIKSVEKLPVDFFEQYFPFIPEFFQKVFFNNYINAKDEK